MHVSTTAARVVGVALRRAIGYAKHGRLATIFVRRPRRSRILGFSADGRRCGCVAPDALGGRTLEWHPEPNKVQGKVIGLTVPSANAGLEMPSTRAAAMMRTRFVDGSLAHRSAQSLLSTGSPMPDWRESWYLGAGRLLAWARVAFAWLVRVRTSLSPAAHRRSTHSV